MMNAGKGYQHGRAGEPKDAVAVSAFTLPPLRRHYLPIFVLLALLVIYHWYLTNFNMSNDPSIKEEYRQKSQASQPVTMFLPWNKPFTTTSTPVIRATIEGVSIDMPVDTGSTGVLISASLLPHLAPDIGTPAFHYLTSSRILYNGRLVNLNIVFHGSEDSYAEAKVPVFVVDKSWICPWYNPNKDGYSCPQGPNGEQPQLRDKLYIIYMGIGFGRNRPGSGQPGAVPAANPFLNIASVNGRALSSGEMQPGWIISTKGVQVGLSEFSTKGFHFTQLERGVIHDEDARDWAMVRTHFSVNGREAGHGGFGLVDTGIGQMYIRAEKDSSLPLVKIPNPNPNGTAKEVERVKPGTHITVGFSALRENEVARYSFVVGGVSPMTPNAVVPGKQTPGPFVNTGRNFLYGFSIAFDAIRGRFGFCPTRLNPPSSL